MVIGVASVDGCAGGTKTGRIFGQVLGRHGGQKWTAHKRDLVQTRQHGMGFTVYDICVYFFCVYSFCVFDYVWALWRLNSLWALEFGLCLADVSQEPFPLQFVNEVF